MDLGVASVAGAVSSEFSENPVANEAPHCPLTSHPCNTRAYTCTFPCAHMHSFKNLEQTGFIFTVIPYSILNNVKGSAGTPKFLGLWGPAM